MEQSKKIRIPWVHRWRRFRYSVLPVVSFVLCVVLTGWLWMRQDVRSGMVGEVARVRLEVTSGTDGTLVPLSQGQWTLFDAVKADQVLARLDDRPAQAAVQTLREELVRLGKELDAAEIRATLDQTDRRNERRNELTRLIWQMERLRLEMLDRTVEIESSRVELRRRNARLEQLKPLHDREVLPELEWTDEQLLRDQVAKQIEENTRALKETERQRALAEGRLRSYPAMETADVERLVAPLQASITAQEARIGQLQLEIEALEIRAPITGTICEIHTWPGQNIRAGTPVVTIAADYGPYIVSYVRNQQGFRPTVGMPVDVRVRAPGSRPFAAVVQRVGPQVEPVPAHQLRDPKTPEWGLPVRISLPSGFSARPGELVDIRFTAMAKRGS